MNVFNLLQVLENNGVHTMTCETYGEQSYKGDEGLHGVLLANWNEFDKYPNIMETLEKHFALEWIDEWLIDYDHSECFRTTGNFYGWQRQFAFTDDGLLLTYREPVNFWIENFQNNYSRALPNLDFLADELIEKEGWELLDEEFANGWHHRNDQPSDIAEDLESKGLQYLFKLTSVSQFETGFCVFTKE